MKVVDRLSDFEYVCEQDKELPAEEQTTWTLKGLSYDTQQSLEARLSPQINLPGSALSQDGGNFRESMKEASVSVDIAGGRTELQFDILRQGIVAVDNLLDTEGEEVKYPGPKSPANVLKNWFGRWIPSEVRTEIANVIIEGSTLSEDDVKN